MSSNTPDSSNSPNSLGQDQHQYQPPQESSGQSLTAYRLGDTTGWSIEPAQRAREWMDRTPRKAAYWCLPVMMANQAGWVIRLPGTAVATWNGKDSADAVKLDFPGKGNRLAGLVGTNFGAGIVSFALPWVFQTTEGTGLWVRGVPNAHTPDCVPLEGIVETDWSPFPFTMNYRIIKRNTQVYFPEGMELCMLAPVRMDLFEATQPRMEDVQSNPLLVEELRRHSEKRRMQTGSLRPDASMVDSKGQTKPVLDYFKGTTTDADKKASKHRKAFELRGFDPQR